MNYKQKYLKYKKKYISLKNITRGGATTVYFDNEDDEDNEAVWNDIDDEDVFKDQAYCEDKDERIDCWWKFNKEPDNGNWILSEICGPFNEETDDNGNVTRSKKDVMLQKCRNKRHTNYKFYGLEHHSEDE